MDHESAPITTEALLPIESGTLPAAIVTAGPDACCRFFEFFFVTIRNENTRLAYAQAVIQFFGWAQSRGVQTLERIDPMLVAAYIEQHVGSIPTIKQHLAGIKRCFDWLVTGHIIRHNPASSVRGPKHVVKRGKTPVLTADEARQLLDSIDTSTLIGLRDRALIGVMVYSFARVSAAVSMQVEDFYVEGKRWWFRLHEKGSKRHEVPVHHNADAYLDAYINAAGLSTAGKSPLFRSADKQGQLTERGMTRNDALRMMKRRAKAAGLSPKIGCHSLRATGITAYLQNGGAIEHAQNIAAHSSPRTTKLYDRRADEPTLDEIEKIVI